MTRQAPALTGASHGGLSRTMGITASPVAVFWLPEDNYARGRELWPDFAQDYNGVPHDQYCRSLDARVRAFAVGTESSIVIASVELDRYLIWCREHDYDPADPDKRSGYAAIAANEGRARSWPPADTDPCWCGRPNLYFACCKT
jgi:hypothetical protein